jgi:ribose-phosphate pyrophosphokinase
VAVGGAKRVLACATHGVLSNNATQRVEESVIEELILLNTIPLPEGYHGKKIHQLDVSPVFAKAIRHIYEETSISDCF